VILRVATVAPEPVPASRPMLYGVVSVHWTWTVEVWSTLVVSTPWVPKFSVEALLIVHEAVIEICTVKVDVVGEANGLPDSNRQMTAATILSEWRFARFSMTRPHMSESHAFPRVMGMCVPARLRRRLK